jgi:hypothetical protein
MAGRNTLIRSMHDLGLAAWFGGNLMGAVGLNGAASGAQDPVERLTPAALGWKKWAPLQAAALTVHAIGGVGLIGANKGRLATQKGGRTNTGVKLAITLIAAGTTLWSGVAGKRLADHAGEGTEGTTEPSAFASRALTSAQNQLRILQWATPVLTGILIILAAQHGEQQRLAAGLMKPKTKRR